MAGTTLVFTVCTAEQYPFAQVLAKSLPNDITFKAGIIGASKLADAAIVKLEDLPYAEIAEMQKRYDPNALVHASKAFYADYFLQPEQVERVIYFDSTTLVLDLAAVLRKAAEYAVVLTPRLTRKFGQSAYGDEKMFLNTGMYDNGFFVISKSPDAFHFLKWWQQRLTDRAYFDLCSGMNLDQLWLNYVPILFENSCICKNTGWNVGLHNLHERVLTYQNNQWLVNQRETLAFFNFKECLDDRADIQKMIQQSGATTLVNAYKAKVKHNGTIPSVFSLRNVLNPAESAWREGLKKRLKSIVDAISYFPIYHKITK
ncbi:hypothetical protein [Runella slithyformis]|uniref:Glycosyl transferase, group 1 n=1 Tax=Runella slithyformis (strain ATCC 29530 / DSM 19594 / LMG 11500 / NCIMB 11436 / LSU 4) TaxID=761193 RepID=A0A7U3ZIX6_RUNSL|nr:hypothetical protein [Runella slithyformis]AEI47992.1 glycosyl transferase, group 1 [Runella slithyformis DSM 19594]